MMRKKRRGLLLWLTNHLTYAQKYVFAGFVRGIGFFIFWFYLLYLILHQISLIKAELSNSEIQEPLRNFYETVVWHERFLGQFIGGDQNLRGELEALEERGTQQLAKVIAQVKEVKNDSKVLIEEKRETLQSIERLWGRIAESSIEGLLPDPHTTHQSLLAGISSLMEQTADNVILSMNPVNISYFLLENIQNRLRESQELIRRAVYLTETARDEQRVDEDVRSELMSITLFLRRDSAATFNELIKIRNELETLEGFTEVSKNLRIAMNQYQVSVEEFIHSIEEIYISAANPDGLQTYVSVEGAIAISDSYSLWRLISDQLDQILEKKKHDLWMSMLYVFFLGISFTFLGSYLGVHFVYEAIKCFRDLDNGTRKLTQGNLSVRVPVLYTEEIGMATMAFNRMADHLEQLINQHRKVFKATQRVADGDFSYRVHVDENAEDEMKQVSISFNNMAQTFEEIVRQLQRLGVNLSSSAGEITAASKQQEKLIIEQGEATREISITASEISTTAKDFARTINDVSQVAEQTSNLASDGQDSLITMEQIMRQMVNASTNIAEKLAALNEKAGNITKIITTITNVARQTNLLSLNAAIEAEKTGQFSRDFSVIAREIRRLADQTALATFDIEKICNEIMGAVSSCVSGVEDFTKEINFGVEKVGDVGEQLGKIIVQVQALAYRFESVNEGMQGQSGAAEKINESMVQLSHSTSSTTESIHQFHETIEELSLASEDLRHTIGKISISKK